MFSCRIRVTVNGVDVFGLIVEDTLLDQAALHTDGRGVAIGVMHLA